MQSGSGLGVARLVVFAADRVLEDGVSPRPRACAGVPDSSTAPPRQRRTTWSPISEVMAMARPAGNPARPPSAVWRGLVALLAAALLATGCSESGIAEGGEDAATAGGEEEAADTEAATVDSIRVVLGQYSDQTQPFWSTVAEEFEAETGIAVELQVIDWNSLLQQVPTWTQTGQLPDILGYNAFSTFAAEGLLHPAEDVIGDELQDDLIDSLIPNTELDGTPYAVPLLASVRGLGYNEAILEEIGAEPPTTWDELVEVARAATDAGYTGYCLPVGSEEAQAVFSLFIWGNGGDWKAGDEWAINSPENVEAVEFMRTLAVEEQVTQPNPGRTNRTDGCWEPFAQGTVAMTEVMPLGTFQTSFMEESDVEWSSVPFPRASTDIEEFTLGVTDFFMAFDKPGNLEAVRQFLAFAFETDRYVEWIETEGFLPITESGSEAMADDPVAGPGIELLPNARFYPTTDPAWNEVQAAVQSRLGTALDPDGDPQAVLDELQQTAEEASSDSSSDS